MGHSLRIQQLTEQLGGIGGRDEYIEAGIPASAVDQEVRIGRLRAVHPGVYRSAAVTVDQERRLLAALKAAGRDGAVSHRAAAHRLGLTKRWADVVELVVRHHARPRLHDVTVRRTTWLPVAHVRPVRGLRTTTIDRTLADLGAVADQGTVDELVQQAVVARRTTVERLYAFVDQYGRQGRTGIATLRACLDDWVMGERPPESVLEVLFARLVRRSGLPSAVYQHEIRHDGRFVARADAAWPGAMLVVEVDGLHSHSTASALQRDHDRQNDLVALGWTVLRFTWRDVVQRPEKVAAIIARRLADRPTPSRP